MTLLRSAGDRLFRRHAPAQPRASAAATDAAPAPCPFDGYDRLDSRHVVDGLSDHTQVELEAIERYERSHHNREQVLDKLRYMREREPLAGYDALSPEQIVSALDKADPATIKRVRGYERKFARRPVILEQVARVHHRSQAANPPAPVPAYRAAGAART